MGSNFHCETLATGSRCKDLFRSLAVFIFVSVETKYQKAAFRTYSAIKRRKKAARIKTAEAFLSRNNTHTKPHKATA